MCYSVQSDFLFVYGTLMFQYDHELNTYVKKNSKYLGRGFFNGLLFDLGKYPAAAYIKGSNKRVHGDLFRITNRKQQVLHTLDEYEGDEYIREVISIQQTSKVIPAFCYLYALPFNGLNMIKSGDYSQK